jgi:GrpB-like predicted nucleotidyltransferase (UPF0157 family)
MMRTAAGRGTHRGPPVRGSRHGCRARALRSASRSSTRTHVFGYDSPELVKHRIFRDWLRGNPADRDLYARAKSEASDAAYALGEHSMQHNGRKTRVVREIYRRAFVAVEPLDE